jgi:transposase
LPEPTARSAARCHHYHLDLDYCPRCDLLVGLDGLRVTAVDRDEDRGRLTVEVESLLSATGCRACGVMAHSRRRRAVVLIDAPRFDRPARVVWRERTWRCLESSCPAGTFN